MPATMKAGAPEAAVAALTAAGGNQSAAARALGISRATLQNRLDYAQRGQGKPQEFDFPKIEDGEPPIEEVIGRMERDFARRAKHNMAKEIITIRAKSNAPMALCWFGDPHIDDNGCDWPALRAHMAIVKATPGMYACNLGDSTNNWVGNLGRLYAAQDTSKRTAIRLLEWMLQEIPWFVVIAGNHDCVDMETEALTRRGWMRYADIRDTDQVLSLDPATGVAEWHPILDKFSRPNAEPMVAISRLNVDMNVTAGHRVLHRPMTNAAGQPKYGAAPFGYARADSLPTGFQIPLSGASGKADVAVSDSMIALSAWVLTDGSILRKGNYASAMFWQSKPSGRAKIEALLAAENLDYTLRVRERDIKEVCGRALKRPPLPAAEYRLNAETSARVLRHCDDKDVLPGWTYEMSDRQFDVFLAALVDANGTWSDEGQAAVLHGKPEILNQIQACAVSHGWRAFISVAKGRKDVRLNLSRRATWEGYRQQTVKEGTPAAEVWCLTVPLGNFMCRRNGKAHFTGNCWSGDDSPLQWLQNRVGAYSEWSARFKIAFPNGQNFDVNASHDHPGHSQDNPLHGQMKAKIRHPLAQDADLIVAGHKHTAAIACNEDIRRDRPTWYVRARGYKMADHYARNLGYPEQKHGQSVVSVINPASKNPMGLCQCFLDPAEAAEYLTFLRAKKTA